MLDIPNQYLKMVICTMNLNQKLDLIQELIDTSTDSVVADHSSVHVIIIGGPAIVHMVQPKSNCTVDEYCKSYMKYVVNFFNKTTIIDRVFDVYLESNLKKRYVNQEMWLKS